MFGKPLGYTPTAYDVPVNVYAIRRRNLLTILETMKAVELAERSGIAATTISRYKREADDPHHKNISEQNAPKLEKAAGKPYGWLSTDHSVRGVRPRGIPVALPMTHQMSHASAPELFAWERLVTEELPEYYRVVMPDDSMGPDVDEGDILTFERGRKPKAGERVLVADRGDGAFLRRYRPRGTNRWQAMPDNDSYDALDSEQDGLRILGVMIKWERP